MTSSYSKRAHLLKLIDQIAMSLKLSNHAQPLCAYDADQVAHGDIKILINNNIVELAHMRDLLAGGREPPLDHIGRILAACHQAFAQRIR